jgi:hypothetical protein
MKQRYLTSAESDYETARRDLLERVSKEYVAESPMCFSSRVSVQSLITRYEMYKLILNVPGDIIECGVYRGNSFTFLAHLSVILEPFSVNRRLIGFDTFEGFSSIDPSRDPSDVTEETFADTSIEVLENALSAIDRIRPVNKVERFKLVKGDITNSLPQFIAENPWMTCALLILDTDLYAPTKIALEEVLPLMPKGGVIVFDEFNYQNYPGETQALRDTFGINSMAVRKLPYESCTAYIVL